MMVTCEHSLLAQHGNFLYIYLLLGIDRPAGLAQPTLKNLRHCRGSPTFLEKATCSMSGARRSTMISPRRGHFLRSSVLMEIQVSLFVSS